MTLTIIKDTSKDLSKFLPFLIKTINRYFDKNINKVVCNSWNEYLAKIGNKNYNTYTILQMGFNNLRFVTFEDKYIIEINNNILYNNQNLSDLCSMINKGTLDQPAYSIFDDAFNYIKENASTLYTTFQLSRKQKNVI